MCSTKPSAQIPDRLDWSRVNVPTAPDWSLKDPALTYHNGWWVLLCSAFYDANESMVVCYRSRDLATWEGPLWQWGTMGSGFCSPDISRVGATFIMTLQSWDGLHPRVSRNQLFYACSNDAETWTEPRPLAANLTHGLRAIDAALAQHANRWFLIYKEGQTVRLATATHLDSEWELLPQPFERWAENGQFLRINGVWHLLATLDDRQQGLAVMHGDPDQIASWSTWSDFEILTTPIATFNAGIPANASAIWDGRSENALGEHTGYWYRVFCSHREKTHGNLGYTLGIARSTDRRTWHLPPSLMDEPPSAVSDT